MSDAGLRVLWLYPEHMNIYADRGNIAVLERRCRWRGIDFELARPGRATRSTPTPTTSSTWEAARTATRRSSRATWSRRSATRWPPRVDSGASMLAVCGGYQLLGRSYALPAASRCRASASSTCERCASPARA